MQLKYNLPDFLKDTPESVYLRWLNRKAQSLVRRDRRRWGQTISASDYKQAIHDAVMCSKGRDFYTGEQLDWSLISKYDNRDSQRLGSQYKRKFAPPSDRGPCRSGIQANGTFGSVGGEPTLARTI